MTKKTNNTFSSVATAINDFTLHKLNKVELYEIIVSCIIESTNDDKDIYHMIPPVRNEYTVARDWLKK